MDDVTFVDDAPIQVGDAFTHTFLIDDSVTRTGGSTISSFFNAVVLSSFEIPSRGFTLDWVTARRVSTNTFFDRWELRGDPDDVVTSIPTFGTFDVFTYEEFFFSLNTPDDFFGSPPIITQPDPAWDVNDYFARWNEDGGTQRYTIEFAIDTFVELPIDDFLAITAQPPIATAVDTGETVELAAGVNLEASNILLQWRKDGVDLADDGRISGATTDTLTIAGAIVDDAGVYTLVISTDSGSRADLISDTSTLAVRPAPTPDCPADLDPPGGDGELGFFDLVAYLTLFGAGCP